MSKKQNETMLNTFCLHDRLYLKWLTCC